MTGGGLSFNANFNERRGENRLEVRFIFELIALIFNLVPLVLGILMILCVMLVSSFVY